MTKNEILQLLPDLYRRSAPQSPLMDGLLDVMSWQHSSLEKTIENISSYYNPFATSDNFVPFLATWVGYDYLVRTEAKDGIGFGPGIGRLRLLISKSVLHSQIRGTLNGMKTVLETATGIEPFEVRENFSIKENRIRPFHISVKGPAGSDSFSWEIARIIQHEKPAYVTSEHELS